MVFASAVKTPVNGQRMRVIVPVSKGNTVAVGYTAAGITEYFRFVYANGSAPAA